MKLLVLNAGSSSLKFELFEMPAGLSLAHGLVERIGDDEARLSYRRRGPGALEEKQERRERFADHGAALEAVIGCLVAGDGGGALSSASEVEVIGHRVVHGGERFTEACRIGPQVVEAIEEVTPLAPLHNPANLRGIAVSERLFPEAAQVAVFDTAFHQTLPPKAYHYAVPQALYEAHGVRRYGFHGTSHAFVAKAAAAALERPLVELKIISLHLGNGASAAAIAGGRSVDTSMGMTPLEGLVMGTRSGDLDPAVHFFLAREEGLDILELDALLNRESGLRGLCGENDMREVLRRADAGDASARLAIEVYCYRIRKYIGSYFAVLGGLDALIFTAGVGENSPQIRAACCEGLEALGVAIDAAANERGPGPGVTRIGAPGAAAEVLVVRTDEELEIAQQAYELVME